MTPEIELRSAPQPVELRTANGRRVIGGIASPFGKRSHVMNGIGEVVENSMWNKSRGDGWNGVLAKVEHRDVIGSIRAGTLQLEIVREGLDYTVDVARTHAGDDALELVRAGIAPFSSIGFRCFEETWSYDDSMPVRHLISGLLTEVSVVSAPAYPDTHTALRSLANHFDAPLDDVIQCGGDYSKFFTRTDNIQSAPALVEARGGGMDTATAKRELERLRPTRA
jgi:HK97 family phage prohead protease